MKTLQRSILMTLLLLTSLQAPLYSQSKSPFALVIHGGAGTIKKSNMTPELEENYRQTLTLALNSGYHILQQGGKSVDAVEAAIVVMEDSPLFNAGKGAVFTHAQTNEMDASIMEGTTLNAGAVGGVKTIKNPIKAARLVMDKSKHVMMVGDGADSFAKKQGLELASPEYFFTQKRFDQLQKIKHKDEVKLDHSSYDDGDNPKFGTVGAVALDQFGHLAAGTSTGGMTNKRYGRVGDSPIIGAGTYANNQTCAISATGHGEYFIRAVVAHDIHARMLYKNLSLSAAADAVIMKQLVEMKGNGGIIGVDKAGNIAMTFNTSGMYRGYKHSNGQEQIAIYKND